MGRWAVCAEGGGGSGWKERGQRVAAPRVTTSDPPASPGIATPSPGLAAKYSISTNLSPPCYRYYIYTVATHPLPLPPPLLYTTLGHDLLPLSKAR